MIPLEVGSSRAVSSASCALRVTILFGRAPWPPRLDHLGLEQPDYRLGQVTDLPVLPGQCARIGLCLAPRNFIASRCRKSSDLV